MCMRARKRWKIFSSIKIFLRYWPNSHSLHSGPAERNRTQNRRFPNKPLVEGTHNRVHFSITAYPYYTLPKFPNGFLIANPSVRSRTTPFPLRSPFPSTLDTFLVGDELNKFSIGIFCPAGIDDRFLLLSLPIMTFSSAFSSVLIGRTEDFLCEALRDTPSSPDRPSLRLLISAAGFAFTGCSRFWVEKLDFILTSEESRICGGGC